MTWVEECKNIDTKHNGGESAISYQSALRYTFYREFKEWRKSVSTM